MKTTVVGPAGDKCQGLSGSRLDLVDCGGTVGRVEEQD